MVHSTIPKNICSGIRDPDLILKCFNNFQDGVIGAAGQDFHGYIRHEICRKSGRLVLVLRHSKCSAGMKKDKETNLFIYKHCEENHSNLHCTPDCRNFKRARSI